MKRVIFHGLVEISQLISVTPLISTMEDVLDILIPLKLSNAPLGPYSLLETKNVEMKLVIQEHRDYVDVMIQLIQLRLLVLDTLMVLSVLK